MKDDGSERPARIALDLASRRGAITGGLAATLSWLAPAGAETLPPVLTSGRHQFTLVSPRRMLPSIRLFSLGGGTLDLASLRGRADSPEFLGELVSCVPDRVADARQAERARSQDETECTGRFRGSGRSGSGRPIRSVVGDSKPFCLSRSERLCRPHRSGSDKSAVRSLRNADHLPDCKFRLDRRLHAWRRGLDRACGGSAY